MKFYYYILLNVCIIHFLGAVQDEDIDIFLSMQQEKIACGQKRNYHAGIICSNLKRKTPWSSHWFDLFYEDCLVELAPGINPQCLTQQDSCETVPDLLLTQQVIKIPPEERKSASMLRPSTGCGNNPPVISSSLEEPGCLLPLEESNESDSEDFVQDSLPVNKSIHI